jgi:hypothetical protein
MDLDSDLPVTYTIIDIHNTKNDEEWMWLQFAYNHTIHNIDLNTEGYTSLRFLYTLKGNKRYFQTGQFRAYVDRIGSEHSLRDIMHTVISYCHRILMNIEDMDNLVTTMHVATCSNAIGPLASHLFIPLFKPFTGEDDTNLLTNLKICASKMREVYQIAEFKPQ